MSVTNNLSGMLSTVPIPSSPARQSVLPIAPTPLPQHTSDIRRVFQTSDHMKDEFVKFLKTIFYQLDEKKVLAAMQELLANPEKSDEEIYKELCLQINSMKKKGSFLSKLWSLFVLKKGIGQQAAQLTKNFRKDKFHDYMEIYDRRYVNSIRKATNMPFDGKVVAVCDSPQFGLIDKIQAGSLLSSYPYKIHAPLNDPDCTNPLAQPEKTHKPVGNEVEDQSVDMIACIGGLHHIPPQRVDGFVDSLHSKLRAGGVILLRDHNVDDNTRSAQLTKVDLKAIASVVHTFVNAADGISWDIEKNKIRDFKSAAEWTQLMEKHGFTRVSPENLVLKDDPTENGMMAFVKSPTTLTELQQTISYRSDCIRSKDGTRATWIEWGNVRYSKQYANYVQNHHSYAFDYVGHLRQHWQYFYNYIKESVQDKEVRLKDLLFSDNMAMNLFILTTAAVQCGIEAITSLPNALYARWKHGKNWRNVCNLTELEKYQAKVEKEYSEYIDHTPFYMFDYIGKMKGMWKVVWKTKESLLSKIGSVFSATIASISYLINAAISTPVRAIYTSEANLEPDTIKILISDPNNELKKVIERWEREKDQEHNKKQKIEVLHGIADGHKLVSIPRYRPFTKICSYLTDTTHLKVLEIGSQKEISVDVLLDKNDPTPQVDDAKVVYEMPRLQDSEEKRYVTYQVNVSALKVFQDTVGINRIEYIHE